MTLNQASHTDATPKRGPGRPQTRPTMRCRQPGCQRQALQDGTLCPPHRDEAQTAAEIAEFEQSGRWVPTGHGTVRWEANR